MVMARADGIPGCCRSSSGQRAAMGDVDIAFILGLLGSGLDYVLLIRSLDVSRELQSEFGVVRHNCKL
jgi:hypothetical protein